MAWQAQYFNKSQSSTNRSTSLTGVGLVLLQVHANSGAAARSAREAEHDARPVREQHADTCKTNKCKFDELIDQCNDVQKNALSLNKVTH